MTYRRSMRVMSIEIQNRTDDNSFDKRILGQYVILRVVHTFDGNGYTNTIKAVTPNNTKSLNQSTGEII